jgi:hypothetical protein
MTDTPRTDQWIERYNLMRGTGLEAFPMDLEYELKAKDAIIADMGKRFDKLGADLAAMTATAEDYRKQVCTPDNCRRIDQAENQKSCNWCEDEDENWATSCRHMFTFDDGGPSENHFNVCPFCSGKIQEIKFVEEL